MSDALEEIIEHGNRDMHYHETRTNHIVCKDGFKLSVIAGCGAYCSPRPDSPYGNGVDAEYSGPYWAVEVGYPSAQPEPWDGTWNALAESPESPTDTVYGYVDVEIVRALVELHGGAK